jgi:hypothetical protein
LFGKNKKFIFFKHSNFTLYNFKRSSVPIHQNVTIGIFKSPDNQKSYKLVLEDSGDLNLYDAIGALIWCGVDPKCKHRFGYKFPEMYLVPINIITPWVENDRHNSISSLIKKVNITSLHSLDSNCNSTLFNNQAIVSPNGRFKLVLEYSGNLIIKDNYRTMWESASGFLPYAEAPMQLVLSATGNLLILDKNMLIVWSSVNDFLNASNPFKMELLDTGVLTVSDKNKLVVWESSPIRNLSFGNTFFIKMKYRFKKCHLDDPERQKVVKELKSNGRNSLENGERLESENGTYFLEIKEYLIYVNKIKTNVNTTSIIISDNGDLIIFNNLKPSWKSNSRGPNSIYTVFLSESGVLYIKNLRNNFISYYIIFNATIFNKEKENPTSLKLIVPMFFYPKYNDKDWISVANAAQRVKITAIIKIINANGLNVNYRSALRKLKHAGVSLIGYISTQNGTKNHQLVKNDIRKFLMDWSVDFEFDGVYLDEIDAKNLKYYLDIYHYTKHLFGKRVKVISSFKTITKENIQKFENITDALVIFEDQFNKFNKDIEQHTRHQFKNSEFIAIINSFTSKEDLKTTIAKAKTANIREIYITNDTPGDPYDTLSSYFNELVGCIELSR